MEANEIMVNEEVIETAEEIATSGPSKGFKIAAGVGIAALVGGLAYKFIAKPIVAKIKAKKAEKEIEAEYDYVDDEVEATDED